MAVKFTEKAEKVLQLAGNEARRLGHGYIGTEHILWALLHQPDSVAVQAIQKCDRTTDELLRSRSIALFPSGEIRKKNISKKSWANRSRKMFLKYSD